MKSFLISIVLFLLVVPSAFAQRSITTFDLAPTFVGGDVFYLVRPGTPNQEFKITGEGIFSGIVALNGTLESFKTNDDLVVFYEATGEIPRKITLSDFFMNISSDADVTIKPAAGAVILHQATLGNKIYSIVSPASNDDPFTDGYVNKVTTSDATVTTLHTVPITASRTYRIHAEVVARRWGGSDGTANDGAAYTKEWAFTTKTGTVTQLGADAVILQVEDQAGWDFDAVISGSNVLLRVTGAADNSISWNLSKCEISYVGF